MAKAAEHHTTAMTNTQTSHKQKIAELENTMAEYQVGLLRIQVRFSYIGYENELVQAAILVVVFNVYSQSHYPS